MDTVKALDSVGVVIDATSMACQRVERLNIASLIDEIFSQGLVVLKGFEPLNDTDMELVAKEIGPLLQWDFGYVLDLKIQEQPQNHIFSEGKVELHWDGAFASEEPRFNFFQCLQSSSSSGGGETTFLNTTRLLESLPNDTIEQWKQIRIRYETEKKAHYGGVIEVPLISRHPKTGKPRMRYIEPFNKDNMAVNPVEAQVIGFDTYQSDVFLKEMNSLLYSSNYFYKHSWRKGEFVFVDNLALLHGRSRFEGSGLNRHLKRVHIL
ncbi:TauD/TfdA family dioxygenase [Pseudoalteromonas sp. Of11M-6]|uniref:TauD/TfdA family dioxygenase n=1 Tax=Pseudoalteromonas sp. Of11M-6 TaxID=2917754 RepID=UPI001EF5110B|nr:TauD/TfdA family dioxygenase [Pseudoalteromonas sp. Of11M-6]MCG7551875.1 TauD/TfdA family dioxygenase [Pseudoalteromonas sp. Of11M-6]